MRRAKSLTGTGISNVRQRRWAWLAFALLALNAPVTAFAFPDDDTWAMSIAVAGLVAYLLVVDDVLRRRKNREENSA